MKRLQRLFKRARGARALSCVLTAGMSALIRKHLPRLLDGRTKANRRLFAAAAGAAGFGAGYLGSKLGGSGMPRTIGKYRSRRRRFKGKRKGATYKRRGRRYTSRRVSLYKRLNTNFAVNDYRKYRSTFAYGTDLIVKEGNNDPNPIEQNNFSFEIRPDFLAQFTDNKDDYREFKLANIQFVIEPRSLVTGSQAIRVQNLDIPYLAARTTASTSTAPTVLAHYDVRKTPGYTFIPLMRKKRTVINFKPYIRIRDTVIQAGPDSVLERTMPMPWLQTDVEASSLDYGRLEVRVPTLDNQNGDELRFSVRMYATILFRGAVKSVVPPVPT